MKDNNLRVYNLPGVLSDEMQREYSIDMNAYELLWWVAD